MRQNSSCEGLGKWLEPFDEDAGSMTLDSLGLSIMSPEIALSTSARELMQLQQSLQLCNPVTHTASPSLVGQHAAIPSQHGDNGAITVGLLGGSQASGSVSKIMVRTMFYANRPQSSQT